MKRTRSQAEIDYRRSLARKRLAKRRAMGLNTVYPSRVPMATRGYRPNPHERKVIDSGSALNNISLAGVAQSINLCANGADMDQRIGRKILMKSFQIRAQFDIERVATTPFVVGQSPSQTARMILLYDAQPNGTIPGTLDILTNADATAPLNLNFRDRFKILIDKTFSFDAALISTAENYAAWNRTTAFYKKYKKLNLETVFNATTANISSVTTGTLVLFFIGTSPTGTADLNVRYQTRVRFIDQ